MPGYFSRADAAVEMILIVRKSVVHGPSHAFVLLTKTGTSQTGTSHRVPGATTKKLKTPPGKANPQPLDHAYANYAS